VGTMEDNAGGFTEVLGRNHVAVELSLDLEGPRARLGRASSNWPPASIGTAARRNRCATAALPASPARRPQVSGPPASRQGIRGARDR
jgi:hypothetical protein